MNITAVKSIVEHIKSNNSINEYAGQESLTIVRCEVNTSDGITGVGITGRFFASDVSNFINHHISHNLSGKDPLDIELITTLLIKKFNPRQATGIFMSAISALDQALWDIKGKLLNLPISKLIGGARTSVDAYATVGLPVYNNEELIEACVSAIDQGFKGVKILVGFNRTIAEDAERIKNVRRAIGEAQLMIDANCSYTISEAKQLASKISDFDINFFEEPLQCNDLRSLAHLRQSTSIPISSGQMIQSITWFRDALNLGSLDILQPNVAFCGGISAMLRILSLAEVYNIPVIGAGGFEAANLPVMAGHSYGGMLEVHNAHHAIKKRFETHPKFINGQLITSELPGIGFSFIDNLK